MEELITCKKLAQRYGVRVQAVYDWVKAGRIPAMKIGKSYYFRPEDVEAFEAAGRTV